MSFPQQDAIRVEDLTKTFAIGKGREITSVDSLNLNIPQGQVFGFLGANGAGKTTTLKMVCGLVTPTSGRIWVDGHRQGQARRKIMTKIGVVLEGTRNVYWRLSAWENLMYFGRLKGFWGKRLKTRGEKLFRDLELWDRKDSVVRQFSRGMQQKVAIACAMIADPHIVLLDEPTLGLDVQTTRTIKRWIARLAADEGKTVILTTHQMRLAQELCESVAIMYQGKMIVNQPVRDLLALFHAENFTIRVQGLLPSESRPRFNGFDISQHDDETRIQGMIHGDHDLYDTLSKLQDLGLPLLGVAKTEPDLEEAFVRLMDDAARTEVAHA